MGAYHNHDLIYHPKFKRMIGLQPPDDFLSNGASWAPDILWGNDLRPAAHWHDYGYSKEYPGPHDEVARYWRDQEFLWNLRKCGLGSFLRHAYYYRVRLWGHWAYHFDQGLEPRRTLGFWLHLFFGRYIEW